jgi:hypothetical protein
VLRAALTLLGCLLLEGCGGGGGGGGTSVAPVIAAAQRPDLLFFYFGAMGQQIRETAAHVNALLPMTWNFENWRPEGRVWIADQVVSQLEEARDAGIKSVLLDVGFLVFDKDYHYEGVESLRLFVERLKVRGLWDRVVALYPVDEPDLQNIDDATMTRVNTDLKEFGKPVACCYTDRRQWPGLRTVDWASFDKYGVDWRGDGVLEDLKNRLRPEQRYFFTVGGADPWRDNVRPVLAAANADPKCVGICAFIYGEHDGNKGIRDNGMLPEYAEVGAKIKGVGR